MGTLGDLLGDSAKNDLFKSSLSPGDVFLKNFEGIDHPKFFVVAGVSGDKSLICSLFINTDVHRSILAKKILADLQVMIQRSQNHFLTHDSFVDCSNPIPMKADNV